MAAEQNAGDRLADALEDIQMLAIWPEQFYDSLVELFRAAGNDESEAARTEVTGFLGRGDDRGFFDGAEDWIEKSWLRNSDLFESVASAAARPFADWGLTWVWRIPSATGVLLSIPNRLGWRLLSLFHTELLPTNELSAASGLAPKRKWTEAIARVWPWDAVRKIILTLQGEIEGTLPLEPLRRAFRQEIIDAAARLRALYFGAPLAATSSIGLPPAETVPLSRVSRWMIDCPDDLPPSPLERAFGLDWMRERFDQTTQMVKGLLAREPGLLARESACVSSVSDAEKADNADNGRCPQKKTELPNTPGLTQLHAYVERAQANGERVNVHRKCLELCENRMIEPGSLARAYRRFRQESGLPSIRENADKADK